MSGMTSISSLYGAALLRLAQAVGLRQAGLAAYLGITRAQVNNWARGKQPIAPAQLPLVVKRIKEALEHALSDPAGPSKQELATLLNDVFRENLQALGCPLYSTLRALLAQLTAVSAIAGAAPDITPYEDELRTLSGALNLVTGIMNDLIELLGMLDCAALVFISGSVEDYHGDTYREESEDHHRVQGVPGARAGAQGANVEALDDSQPGGVS